MNEDKPALPTDPFDRLLSRLVGLPGGAHTKPTVIQSMDFYGHTTSYLVQSVRTEEEGVTAFVTVVNAQGSQRFIIPQRVLQTIDRQRDSITTKLRKRNGKRIAEERIAQGIQPGFLRKA